MVIFFAADANANGAAVATVHATPIVGDISGAKEDLGDFYRDLAADAALAQDLQNADVTHGHTKAMEIFSRFVPYELEQRRCSVFDQAKLADAIDMFYWRLFREFQKEISVSTEWRLFGLAFPITVDASEVGTANINPVVQQFQKDLGNAIVK